MELEQDRVENPEPPVKLVDDRVHERLVELVATLSVPAPPKPFSGETLIDKTPEKPVGTSTLEALAEIEKS